MTFVLVVLQWFFMFVGYCTGSVWAFLVALAIGLYGVARMLGRLFWPSVSEETMDEIYAMADKGPLRPHRGVFEMATKHHGWNKKRFDRWAKGKAWR